MSLSHYIHGADFARRQVIIQRVAHWPGRPWLLAPAAAALALFVASHLLISGVALLVVLCAWFIAGAVESEEDVRRSGSRGR
jgi:hypothetical protein